MKLFPIAILTLGLSVAPAVLAQAPNDLPSAPSATKLEQSKPKPSQAPAPVQQSAQPATTAAPTAAPAAPKSEPTASQPGGSDAEHSASPTAKAEAGSTLPADAPEDEPLTTIKKRVDEVNVIFTVTDKHGHFVKDLTANDFIVRDDAKPPKQIVNFSKETNLPLRVGLLVDASNSIRDRFKFEQESAIEFLSSIIRPKTDKGFVIGFDTTAEVTADFTSNEETLAHGVRMLRPGGGTALYDAVFFACRDKLMKAEQTGPVRRAIVLISDGNDNQSRVTREEAIEMAERAEVIIYAISTNTTATKERGDKVLERMADATGGRAFFPFKIQDVSNAFKEIQDELRSQYAIAYKPAEFASDGKYHAIEIAAENHKNLKVRARKGYYAPKQ